MNSCILMVEITQEPQLRYLSDNQTPIAELEVQFPGARPEDPMNKMKAVGFGNLAQEIQSRYHVGDRVVIEGSLRMNTVERPEGFKEKRAELNVQRIHVLDGGDFSGGLTAPTAMPTAMPAGTMPAAPAPTPSPTPKKTIKSPPPPADEPSLDEIPF
jgi:single-strand DNA-binding protein